MKIKRYIIFSMVSIMVASSLLLIGCKKEKAESETIITKGKFIESIEVDSGKKYKVYNTKIQLEDGSIYEYQGVNELVMNGETKYISQGHPEGSNINNIYLIEVKP